VSVVGRGDGPLPGRGATRPGGGRVAAGPPGGAKVLGRPTGLPAQGTWLLGLPRLGEGACMGGGVRCPGTGGQGLGSGCTLGGASGRGVPGGVVAAEPLGVPMS